MKQIENPRVRSLSSASTVERNVSFPNADRAPRGAANESIMKELAHTLWTHRFLFAAIFVVCTGLAVVLTLAMPPQYQAKATLEVEALPVYSQGGDHAGDASASGLPPTFDAYMDTQIGIMESLSMVTKAVDRVNLAQRLNADMQKRLAATPALLRWTQPSKPLNREEAIEIAGKNLKVRQARLNSLIDVVYNSTDPQTSADFVNALSEEYIQENLESRWDMAKRTEAYLTKQLSDLHTKLEQSEQALQSYSEGAGIQIVGDRSSVAEDKLHELQTELSQAQADRFLKQSQMEMAAGKSADSIPQVLDNATFRDYQAKISDLRRQIADLTPIYTSTNPKVARLQAQLDEIEKAQAKERTNLLSQVHNEYEAADRREKLLTQAYKMQSGVVSSQGEKMVRYNTLKHDADSNRMLYESLLQRVKQSSILSALQATNVRIVDPGVAPTRKFKPSRSMNTALGALAGLIIGLVVVFVREHSVPKLHRAGTTGRYIQAPELGVIPIVGRIALAGPGAKRLGGGMTAALTGGTGASNGKELGSPKGWLDPTSHLSESFRVVMTSLLFSSVSSSRPRVIVVTSPGAGEGKTTVTVNLGATLADTGRRVLLIDGDLRCPRLYELFDLPQSPGLVDMLRDANDPKGVGTASLRNSIQETEVDGLFVLPPGTPGTGELGIFYSDALAKVVDELQPHFDVILIDSPPILPVPEARALARVSDGVVLVLRAGVTEIEAAVEAERRIQQDGSRLLGTILNQANANAERYYRKYARTSQKVTAVS